MFHRSIRRMTDPLIRINALPRAHLAHLPTPLEPMPRLSAELGGPWLHVKRDDCTGLGLGGNKVRKLEFALAEAQAAGADCIVTGGVVQSNHIRQSAAAAAKLGLGCHLAVMHGRVQGTDPDYHDTGNILLDRLFGASITPVDWRADRNRVLHELAETLRSQGKQPHVVAYGASSLRGALGFVLAALELAEQARRQGIVIDHVVHASGSAGTQAGLAVGLKLFMPATRLIGIDIDAEPERVRADVTRLAGEVSDFLGVSPPEIEVAAGHAGPAYGVATPQTVEAIRLAAQLEGLVLDPVYAGKGLAGLIGLIRAGRFAPRETVVFWHTGGAPALFAYRSLFA
jgi:L-cysteate sulfo-lyase